MKKIIKPAEREEAVYYSDFTGKVLNECGPDITLKLDFHYGSKRDGANLELHLILVLQRYTLFFSLLVVVWVTKL